MIARILKKKRMNFSRRNCHRGKAFSLMMNIMLSIVAFSFLVGLSLPSVSGQEPDFVGPSGSVADVDVFGSEVIPTAPYEFVAPPAPPPVTSGAPSSVVPPALTSGEESGISEAAEGIVGEVRPELGGPAVEKATWSTVFLDSYLIGSFVWAGIIGGVVYLGATLLGADPGTAKAAGLAAFSGVATFNLIYRGWTGVTAFSEAPVTLFGQAGQAIGAGGTPGVGGAAFWTSAIAAIGVAIVVYALLYKKESKKIIAFSCEPWEAPLGGGDCEKCNNDVFKPCSEYRCRSLGQACQLLNKGTGNESCAWVNPRDVSSPGIAPWDAVLTKDHKYTDVRIRPPGSGVEPGRMKIQGTEAEGCVKAFTPLQFGVVTTEPAQCKIDFNHTKNFEEMAFFMGGTNLFLYNHSERMSLPGPKNLEISSPELKNDGTYTLYTRCKDANGNENLDEFAIRFCVEKGPDTTPVRIEATGIQNGAPVGFGTSSVNLDVYLNEPAECKWSREDKDYSNMENALQCSTQIFEMNANLFYPCKANLTGIRDRQVNDFFMRCKDQPGAAEKDRNVNQESFKFTLRGTEPLKIIDLKPNGTIQGAGDFVTVFLEVETAFGEHEGDAICYYSTTGKEKDFIKFFETGTNKHRQRQDLAPGNYNYMMRCLDLGGNADSNSTQFTVLSDRTPPGVIRVYHDNQLLKVMTDEKSTCAYSTKDCRFSIANGIEMPYANTTEHFSEWKTDTNFYVKCADPSGNEPQPDSCSIILRLYGKAK